MQGMVDDDIVEPSHKTQEKSGLGGCDNVGSCAIWERREQDGILESDMGFPSRVAVAAILAQRLHKDS